MSKFYNITGSTGVTVELISPTDPNVSIKSILLTNVHDTASATVTLFIQDSAVGKASSTYNLINNIVIPAGSSLLLNDSSIFRFDQKYGLYINVGSSDTVDVFINV
tara:strand:+ start:1682 stop:1999 length:318 start_codon:yes stop_codon:yes gene_type:complete